MEKGMQRPFVLEAAVEVNTPDPEIVSLNSDLVDFDEVVGGYLMDAQRRYVSTPYSLPYRHTDNNKWARDAN